jgi:hypothetical protein
VKIRIQLESILISMPNTVKIRHEVRIVSLLSPS